MKKERISELKSLFREYKFVEVTTYGWIKVSLYPLKYDAMGVVKLIEVLRLIQSLPDYKGTFDANVQQGLYDVVDDVYIDFEPK